jgi:hypothetical protein
VETKITQIENNLKRLDELETSTIEQLDEFILNCWAALEIANNEINDSLYIKEQNEILNTFDWTTGNIEKLLHLNEKLINCLEKLKDMPTAAINTSNIRIKDYE